MKSLITQLPFLTQSTLWSFFFQHKHKQSTQLDRQFLLKQAALLPAWAENKTANDRRQLLTLLLKPPPLDAVAKSTVQGPLPSRATRVSMFRCHSRVSPSSSGRNSTFPCCCLSKLGSVCWIWVPHRTAVCNCLHFKISGGWGKSW